MIPIRDIDIDRSVILTSLKVSLFWLLLSEQAEKKEAKKTYFKIRA
jgi:hypothetical protein